MIRPPLRTLTTAPEDVRTRPEAVLAIHMVRAMVHPPATRSAWLLWMQEAESLAPAADDPAGALKPLLAYHVARRIAKPEPVAYLVGFTSDRSLSEM